MFSERFLRERIREQIDQGKKHFIIFPYGTNGANIKKCFEDYFAIRPEMIIDNEYSKYNSNIMDLEYLKQNYKKNMVVFLTVEDKTLNRNLEDQLLCFINKSQIINLLAIHEKRINKVVNETSAYGKFGLDCFLPNFRYTGSLSNEIESQKIKIRFFHCEYHMWNVIKTICEVFEKDDRYEVLIILRDNDIEAKIEQMKKGKHSYRVVTSYDVKIDKPDIMILYHAWDRTVIKNCRNYVKLIIVASQMLIRYSHSLKGLWDFMRIGFERYYPDYYLFDTLLYEEIKKSEYYSDKIIEMGNAKFDGIYMKSIEEKKYPSEWEKLKGKKVVLWTTDHGIQSGNISDFVTFDLYANTIFKYALEHPDMGFIMRLHRTFVREMLRDSYWSQEDVEILREYCCNTLNLVWDESDSYDLSYSISDAVLTDALCGIICSALPTLKPICVMYRGNKVKSFHPELTDSYYSAHNKQELRNFFDMINKGEDPKYDLRMEASRKYIKHFDGKNGQRIKQFIEDKYFSMIQNTQ